MKVLNKENRSKSKVIFHKNDQKILELLCYNVRLPVSKIAKLLSLGRQSVEYRMKTMERVHLLAGSRTVVNIKKMGYQSYHFFLNLSSKKDEETFIKRCGANDSVNALISYSGKFNFELSIMAKSPKQAKEVFIGLVADFQLNDYFLCILLDSIKAEVLPKNIFSHAPLLKNIKSDPSFSKQFDFSKKEYDLDDKDKKILYELSQDANVSLVSLGRKTSLTKDAVSYRIRNLIRGDYILQFRPVIDYSVLGLNIQAVLIKNKSNLHRQDFLNYLKNNDLVLWASEALGEWDYIMYVINNDINLIHDFVEKMKEKFGEDIQNYEILFAFSEHKYSFMARDMCN